MVASRISCQLPLLCFLSPKVLQEGFKLGETTVLIVSFMITSNSRHDWLETTSTLIYVSFISFSTSDALDGISSG